MPMPTIAPQEVISFLFIFIFIYRQAIDSDAPEAVKEYIRKYRDSQTVEGLDSLGYTHK